MIERWKEAVASGLDPEAAADETIRAFGSAGAVGHELAHAFHGPLYMATVGLGRRYWWLEALPAAVHACRAALLYFIACQVLLALNALAFISLGDALLVAAGAVIAIVPAAIAYWSMGFRQQFAIDFARLAPIVCVGELLSAHLGQAWPQPILVGLAVALVPLWLRTVANRKSIDRWVASRRVRSRLIALPLAVVMLSGAGLAIAAPIVPDRLALAGPEDLRLTLTTDCLIESGDGTEIVNVSPDFQWKRGELAPQGLLSPERGLDSELEVWMEPISGAIVSPNSGEPDPNTGGLLVPLPGTPGSEQPQLDWYNGIVFDLDKGVPSNQIVIHARYAHRGIWSVTVSTRGCDQIETVMTPP